MTPEERAELDRAGQDGSAVPQVEIRGGQARLPGYIDLVGSGVVEQAIQSLAEAAGSLTLDQRLRIAALLARPAELAEPPRPAPGSAASRPAAPESLVLTVEETADLLKVGRTTVYELIKAGRVNSVMIGRLRRIRYEDVVAYLNHLS
jgi:excisionase family DNA binding protein